MREDARRASRCTRARASQLAACVADDSQRWCHSLRVAAVLVAFVASRPSLQQAVVAADCECAGAEVRGAVAATLDTHVAYQTRVRVERGEVVAIPEARSPRQTDPAPLQDLALKWVNGSETRTWCLLELTNKPCAHCADDSRAVSHCLELRPALIEIAVSTLRADIHKHRSDSFEDRQAL